MIDLHLHTTSSDGSDEPKELLAKAQKANLKYISITDHDSIDAYKKLKAVDIHRIFSEKIIPGCEFSAVHANTPIEILGYGLDLDEIDRSGVVSDEKFYEMENGYLNSLKKVCDNLGITYSHELAIKGKYFATQVMHNDIRKYPQNQKLLPKTVWDNLNVFYRTCVNNPESPFFLNQMKDHPSLEEACSIIHNAGGKAFLAHLYGYFADDHIEFLNSMIKLNSLDGVECYHSLHSMERTHQLLDYCRANNLYSSGGSDYHGKLKPNVKLGESLDGVRIPFEILKDWLPENLI